MKRQNRALAGVLCLALLVCGGALVAQTRTTPVTIDDSGNTVEAEQSGAWNVGITGTPSVSVSNTPGVSVLNSPTVNIGNSPTVNIAGTPEVSIDPSQNEVTATTKSQFIQLWDDSNVIASHSYLYSPYIDTKGYKEMRVVIRSNVSSSTDIHVVVGALVGGYIISLGKADFAPPTHSLTDQANFTPYPQNCIFSVPVVSDRMRIHIYNARSYDTTIYSTSWVYLVN